jgi:hypothetical protein
MSLENIRLKRVVAAVSVVLATTAWAGQYRFVRAEGTPQLPHSDQLAQTTTGLSERDDLIGACRVSSGSVDVFADAARTRRLLTLAPNVQMTLTGVVGTGIAEIRYPAFGWVSTLTAEPCVETAFPAPSPAPSPTPTPTPAPTPPPITLQACYRVLTAVNIRTGPNLNFPSLGQIGSGGIAYTTTNPPTEVVAPDGRIWVEINFLGTVGWLSRTGQSSSGVNAVQLPDAQCQ